MMCTQRAHQESNLRISDLLHAQEQKSYLVLTEYLYTAEWTVAKVYNAHAQNFVTKEAPTLVSWQHHLSARDLKAGLDFRCTMLYKGQ